MDEEYNKKIKNLTDRVKHIHKDQVIHNNTEQTTALIESSTNNQVVKTSFNMKSILHKYVKYTYGIIPLAGIILYITKPKFLLKIDKKKKMSFDTSKFIIILTIMTVVIYGLNFAVSYFK